MSASEGSECYNSNWLPQQGKDLCGAELLTSDERKREERVLQLKDNKRLRQKQIAFLIVTGYYTSVIVSLYRGKGNKHNDCTQLCSG